MQSKKQQTTAMISENNFVTISASRLRLVW